MLNRYRLFGETLEVATKLNTSGESMKIQLSAETKNLLDCVGGFQTTYHGLVDVQVRKYKLM